MKKIVSGVLVLLTVAAAVFFILKVRRFVPERTRATELAPAETILFAHVPNLRDTATRFQKTGLHAIWQESEMQEFLQKPRKTLPSLQQWEQRLERLERVAPGEAFLAVTSMDGPQPKFVAGFSFAGKRREVEALLAESREEFRRRWPEGKSDIASHKGATIDVFNYPNGLLAECFVRNWYFIASDVTLLRTTLDRYENPAAAVAGALAGNEIFQKAAEPLGNEPDVMLFARFAALGERFGALMPALGQAAKPKDAADPKAIQAIAACTRIEGTQMRDTVFILSPREATETPLTRSTLGFSGPETFLFFSLGIASLTPLPDSVSAIAGALPGVAAAEKSLAARKLEWSDFGKAFGPEMGTTLEWPDEAVAPSVLFAFELRDAAKAREFVEAVTGGGAEAAPWGRREESDVSIYSAPSEGVTLITLTIAITPRFAILGFSADAVAAGLRRMGAANGADSPLQEAARNQATPSSGFGYLDAGTLFERAYRTLRPALTMSLAFSGDLGDYIDAGKLPSAEMISKHLTPSVFSQSATPSGILMESTGTLTFNQLIIGAITGAAAAFPGSKTAGGLPDRADDPPDESSPKRGVASDLSEPEVAGPGEADRAKARVVNEPDAVLPGRP